MNSLTTAIFATLLSLITLSAHAESIRAGNLSIAHPHSFATPPGATTAAGYLAITNNGATADRLLKISSNFPRAMIHRSAMEDGVMRMRHQPDGVVIPAGATVTFEPGGLHLMFVGLKRSLREGEKAQVTLHFEHSGSVPIVLDVKRRKVTAETHKHGSHGHHKQPIESD